MTPLTPLAPLGQTKRASQRASKARKRTRNHHPTPLPDRFNEPGQPKLLLTVAEAAARMNVSRTTVYRMVMRGECPSLKIGALRRIPVPQLEAYLASLVEGANLLTA